MIGLRYFGLIVLLCVVSANSLWAKPDRLKARLNTWTLYITDDFDITSVIDLYTNASCDAPGALVETVYGKERSSVAARCEAVCCIERVIRDGETIVERVVGDAEREVTDETDIGDTLLTNVGADLQYEIKKFKFVSKGNLTYSALDNRALYGDKKYRARFHNVYGEYEEKEADFAFRARLGRQHINAGALVDGASFDYYFGSTGFRESKSIGAFGGLMPHPITKHIDHEFRTAGLKFHYIPDFSNKTETKLRVDASLVGEAYKSDMHRFYLFTRSHFAPNNRVAIFAYSTVDLPAKGDSGNISSNHFSTQLQYKPTKQWFTSVGFTQFKIDRLLKEQVVGSQGELTNNPSQTDRVGSSLDRSHRYRFDARLAYKPAPLAQPFIHARYERRTFDSNKKDFNTNPNTGTPGGENIGLINKKNAYQFTPGIRFFPMIQLETETSFTFMQRYQSKAYDIYQMVIWDNGDFWTLDAFGQFVWSDKRIRDSNSTQASNSVKSMDIYAGIGGSIKFLSDFLAQIRYDFANEDDYDMGRTITTHTFWARLDYRF